MRRIVSISLIDIAMETSRVARQRKRVVPKASATAVVAYAKTIQESEETEGKKTDARAIHYSRRARLPWAKRADRMPSIAHIPDQPKRREPKHDYAANGKDDAIGGERAMSVSNPNDWQPKYRRVP